jgi:hypothetical protein
VIPYALLPLYPKKIYFVYLFVKKALKEAL